MKKILLISISILFAGEMEVDGNLNVSGNIISPTIDALRDNPNYEYEILMLYVSVNNSGISPAGWLPLSAVNSYTDYNDMSTFQNHITNLFNNGWQIHSINGADISWWIFKRPLN